MTSLSRRGVVSAAAAIAGASALPHGVRAQSKPLTIAYNVPLPSWDPTTGLASVNPGTQSIYRSVFDSYVGQNADLTSKPGLLTEWDYNADKTRARFKVRSGAFWHDGSPVTPDDVIWSLQRAGDKATGNPTQYMWARLANMKADGDTISADIKEFDPSFFKWLSFFTAYVLPRKYYESVGKEGFERKPIGSGPYMVEEFVRNGFVRLKAFDKYWGPKPHFDSVVFKFVTDPTTRIAEVESGASDMTLEIPFEEYDRLRVKPGLAGTAVPISDIAMLFITNIEPMLDKNVRLALHHAIDKKSIVQRLFRGYGVPLDTLLAPEYAGYDPSITVGYDPDKAKSLLAASGFSPQNPVRFTIQTTRGYKPKDYEMIEAIVAMWRRVGAQASIEVYEIAKHFELRGQHKLAPVAFYNWGNSIGDPETSVARAMFSTSVQSAWKTPDVDAMIQPLWSETDEPKRLAGYRKLNRFLADEGYVIPLMQFDQPILYRKGLSFTPQSSGMILPQFISAA